MVPDYKTKTVLQLGGNNYARTGRESGKWRFAFYGVFRLLKIEKNLEYV
jgi:hypothetical protein